MSVLRFARFGHSYVVERNTDASIDERFARMVHEHRYAVTRYGLRRLSDSSLVEDMVAETFVVAWRQRHRLPRHDEEIFWLYGIARRVLANQIRGQVRSLRLEGRLADERVRTGEDPRFDEDDIAALMSALARLDPDEHEIIQLAYWERLDYRGLGLVLECNGKAAGVRLSRARARLRELLQDTPEGVVSINREHRENRQ
jgi:RNA polymerase sigma-70 factor (ECF subfamily)